MFSDLTEFISKCESCQRKKNPIGHLRIRPSTLSRPVPSKPWDIISSDVFHLPLSNKLNQWILLFCDTFSKFVEATPLSTVNGIIASECLMKSVVLKHGCPSQLITDNASYYVHRNFPKLCNVLGIKLSPVTAYHPQANGIAESKVKALKSLVRSLVKQNYSDWDEFLPYTIFSFNTSFNNTIGCSPFFVNHGYEANMPGKIPMALTNQQLYTNIVTDTNQYCQDLFKKISESHILVQNNLKAIANSRTNILDIPQYFNRNDEVFLFSPVPSTNIPKSFQEFWKGPYKIEQVISPVCYRIQNLADPENTEVVYASRLKRKF